MKTRTLLAATLAATLALAGCSKNDEPDGPTRAAVNIRTSIGGTIDAGNFGSRAAISADGSGNFEAGDVLGLYATVGATAKLANSAYTVGSTALWWDELSMTDPVAFAAYYPKAEAITDPAATIFNAATATNPDLLLATPVTASKGEDVALAFRHAMHRLTVNLSTDIDGWDIATARVSLAGMNASATVNITAGTVTPGEADATDGDYGTKTGAAATFVVAPQKVTTNADWIQITMDGEQYVYKVPANITLPGGTTAPLTALESGKTLTLNLALTRDGVTLTTGDIAAWDTQGTIDGEENPINVIYSYKLWESQKYVTLDRHSYSTAIITMSNDLFKSLPEDVQTIFEESAQEAAEYERQWVADQEADQLQEIKDHGMEVVENPDVDSFRAAVQSVYDAYPDYADYIKRIQDALK